MAEVLVAAAVLVVLAIVVWLLATTRRELGELRRATAPVDAVTELLQRQIEAVRAEGREGQETVRREVGDLALRVSGDQLQSAQLSTSSWKPAALPAKATVRAPVVRALSRAYVPAARGDTIYKSLDDGSHWTPEQAPCTASSVVASMSAGADGSVAVMCLPTDKVSAQLWVSDVDGANFTPVANVTKLNLSQAFGAADSSTVFRSSPGGLERSTDRGRDKMLALHGRSLAGVMPSNLCDRGTPVKPEW